MQLTLAGPAVDTIDLVLAAWSDARPAAGETREPDALDELAAQLMLRLDETQIPLWDERAARG